MTAAAPQREALEVHAAGYDLVARLYLTGPRALAAHALPAAGALLDALGRLDRDWPRRVEPLLAALGDETRLAELEQAYEACVIVPIPGRHVPPYASVHLGEAGLWGATTLEVERAYAEAGFTWQAGTTKAHPLAPDHLGLELAFLAVSEAAAGPHPTREQETRLTRFLAGHLLHWLPRYLDALRASNADPYLTGWVAWLHALAEHDLQRVSARGPRNGRSPNGAP